MSLRMLLYCALCGLFLSWGGHGEGGHVMASWWMLGIVLTAGVFPIVHFGPSNFLRRMAAVWMALVLVAVFVPGSKVASICRWPIGISQPCYSNTSFFIPYLR